ncbi:hypothetical protein D9756_009829 [Leucocoprinus leucothites]|uniref:SAP domain-containing protein n=1 Tax=Leucocoprinus leucothites TaxID=201217 RepID=A0A8H5CWG0_9AGAR|nr:hypothetical protein D9756_009829 [Leucoagaricus leucothites]
MSETTEILFNSPALHSLRRDQLQRLCKIHSIKANGKTTEIVDRLRQHALTLPKDDPLSIAARSEVVTTISDGDGAGGGGEGSGHVQRPSEQWEVVMESIEEVEENGSSSQGTLSSLRTPRAVHSSGEFGTANSKSVSSSIRALASSLGLKKTTKPDEPPVPRSLRSRKTKGNDDSLSQHSIPYSATRQATPPLHDNFTFDPTAAAHTRMSFDANGEPLPGCSLRPGEPAPAGARLSMGQQQQQQPATPTKEQPTTTIRLVSNKPSSSSGAAAVAAGGDKSAFDEKRDIFQTPKLKPFATTFDLVMSPSAQAGDGKAFWAPDARPGPLQFQSIYPTLTIDDLPPDVPPSPIKNGGASGSHTSTITMDESKDATLLSVPSTTTTITTATTNTTNTQATTTTTTSTDDPFVFGSPRHSVSNYQFRAAATSVLEEMNKRLGISGVEGVGMDIVDKLQPPGTHRDVKSLPGRSFSSGATATGSGGGEMTKKFDERHRAEFQKMEGIDGVVKRRMEQQKRSSSSSSTAGAPVPLAGKKRKSNVLGELGDGNGKPRRPITGLAAANAGVRVGSVGGGRTSGTTRVISSGRRGMALPGGFGDEEEADGEGGVGETGEFGDGEEGEGQGEGEARGRKRARIDAEPEADADPGKKTKDEDAMDIDDEDHQAQAAEVEAEERRKTRERDAIKRKLEMSRAKRKSSVGGAVAAATKSAAVRRNSRAPPVTPKTKSGSRFGFLASAAKSLVASVWSRGKTPAKSSSVNVGGVDAPTKSSLMKRKAAVPGSGAGFMPTRSSAMTSAATAAASTAGTTATKTAMATGAGSVTSQLSVPHQEQRNVSGSGTTSRSRSPIPPTFNANKPPSTQTASSSKPPSFSSLRPSNTGTGTKVVPKASTVRASSFGNVNSRLFAPTASSLAKMKSAAGNSAPGSSSLLGPITNSPRVLGGMRHRRVASGSSSGVLSPKGTNTMGQQGKIFTKPVIAGGSGIPVLKKKAEGGDKDYDVEMDDPAATNVQVDSGIQKTPGTVTRQRTFTRKPRISRSKVIAKLASQRAAASSSGFRPTSSSALARLSALPGTPRTKPGSSTMGGGAGPGVPRTKRVRSSFAPTRSSGHVRGGSVDGIGIGGGKGKERDAVLASAKKRVRQSEYARRRSRVSFGVAGAGVGAGGDD